MALFTKDEMLVMSVAKHYLSSGVPLQALMNAGKKGLAKARKLGVKPCYLKDYAKDAIIAEILIRATSKHPVAVPVLA